MVIDASVVFKWLVEEPDSPAAIALIGQEDLVAPTLLHSEVGNALWVRIARSELDIDGAEEQLQSLGDLLTTIDETPLIPRALTLAATIDHPVYDCIYLALAEQRADRLITADMRLLRKVRATPYGHLVVELGAA